MFKFLKELFFGKPVQAPAAEVPYKVEAPAPVDFTPPPKAADVVVETPVAPVAVAEVPAVVVPAKKPTARRRPAPAKKPAPKKPVAKRAPAKKAVAK